jgi:hypothetical protein
LIIEPTQSHKIIDTFYVYFTYWLNLKHFLGIFNIFDNF